MNQQWYLRVLSSVKFPQIEKNENMRKYNKEKKMKKKFIEDSPE